ncbi:hypothetical protein C2E23DRAFT_829627 [Lenzites betulinus]|nr:hypothetical protein C2E23DRAFT_829627 [Lenzites betulinus]
MAGRWAMKTFRLVSSPARCACCARTPGPCTHAGSPPVLCVALALYVHHPRPSRQCPCPDAIIRGTKHSLSRSAASLCSLLPPVCERRTACGGPYRRAVCGRGGASEAPQARAQPITRDRLRVLTPIHTNPELKQDLERRGIAWARGLRGLPLPASRLPTHPAALDLPSSKPGVHAGAPSPKPGGHHRSPPCSIYNDR